MPSVAFLSGTALTYPALAARLLTLPPSCGPVRLVAVDGPSGAGKSTFTDHLSVALVGAPVVRSDDFRVPWDADPLTWWEPLRSTVLAPLRDGRPATLRRYDWHRDHYGPPEELPPAPVLIVEGVGAAWAGSPAAYRVWIDAPPDLRRARALDRDGPEYAAAWDAWTTRETAHFITDATRSRADLLVDGTSFTKHHFTAL
ncbi:uridine kinase [Actinomadura pelletieri DSM 43383]|uniref:Uridine kinase n=1 Tax=Actinomadura pelletieri DSM 43383 TaxID=1120940 RepID=A0A495QNI4_9ACTN|nr:AAA family ATPase [Actinomadura pelletieri]RKS74543.1 uridine kinase [Actinomadura pelletieri DSM 43383]